MNSHTKTPKDALDQPSAKDTLDGLSTVPCGTTLVVVKKKDLMTPVRTAFTQQILSAGSDLVLKFPEVSSVRSLYSGSPRNLEYAKARHNACGLVPTGVEHKFRSFGTSRYFDWLGTEGLATILPLIHPDKSEQPPTCYTFEQSVGAHEVSVANGLQQIRHSANAAEVRVTIFFFCKEGAEDTHYDELCDEYIEVDSCEPDVDHDLAFYFDCQGLRDLYALGVGKTMCSIRHEHGRIKHTYSPFIDASFRNRAMWILRGNGSSLAEIGEIVEKNKSTVLRTLRELPRPRKTAVPDGWIDQVKEYLEVEDEPEKRRGQDDHAEELDDNDE
jgi:hypothetical protein